MVALHTGIAIVIAVGLIIWLKVDPVISLLLASLYLGLASGVGFTGTIEAIAVGFGEIMTEVGLLIGVRRTDRSVSPLRRSVPQAA